MSTGKQDKVADGDKQHKTTKRNSPPPSTPLRRGDIVRYIGTRIKPLSYGCIVAIYGDTGVLMRVVHVWFGGTWYWEIPCADLELVDDTDFDIKGVEFSLLGDPKSFAADHQQDQQVDQNQQVDQQVEGC